MKNFLAKYNISNTDMLIMLIAIILQALTGIWAKNDMISFISGMAGIISVVLCSQKKLSFYAFAYIQMFTYMFLTWREALWGELVENIFYVITTAVGIYIWIVRYNKHKYEVKTRTLPTDLRVMCFGLFIVVTILITVILNATNDPYPFLDAVSTVPAIISICAMNAGTVLTASKNG